MTERTKFILVYIFIVVPNIITTTVIAINPGNHKSCEPAHVAWGIVAILFYTAVMGLCWGKWENKFEKIMDITSDENSFLKGFLTSSMGIGFLMHFVCMLYFVPMFWAFILESILCIFTGTQIF